MPVFQRQHFLRLIELAKKNRIAPIYLFVGDPAVSQDLIRKLLSVLISGGALVEQYDLSSEVDLEEIKQALSIPPILSLKVIVAKGKNEVISEEDSREIVGLLDTVKQRLCLILILEKLERSHSLYKYAERQGVIVPIQKAYQSKDLLRYELPQMLSEVDKKMDRMAAELLLEMVGNDLIALRQEINKLSLYVGDSPVIKKEDILSVVSPREEHAPYALMEALFTKGPEEALKLLRDLLEQGIHYLAIMGMLVTFFKRLWGLKYLISKDESLRYSRDYNAFKRNLEKAEKALWSGNPPRVLAKTHPYALFRMCRYVNSLSEEKIIEAIFDLAEIDRALKTRPISPEDLFYSFFLKIRLEPFMGTFEKFYLD